MILHEQDSEKRISCSRRDLTRQTAGAHLAVELRETAKLALPMVLTQIGQVAMMTTDLAFIGRIGTEALAAAALAGRIYVVSFAFSLGLVASTAPLVAQAFGANNLGVVRRATRMGLWMAQLLSLLIIACALRGERILLALGQQPDAARLGQQYLHGLAWGVAPALCFHALRSFMVAVNRPEPALWITLTASPINAVLAYLLINGKLGLPRLELFGAGLATTLVNCTTLLAGLWLATLQRPFRDYRVLAYLWRFDWPLMRQLLVIGTPTSIYYLTSSGLFSIAAFLVSTIGTSALVAHQIALQVSAIILMISSGIGMAATVRVGHAVGRNDGAGVKRAGLAAILLGIAITAILILGAIAVRFEIASFFLSGCACDADAMIGLAAKLILVGAGLFIGDALQSIAAGALRGLNETRVPLLFALAAHWVISLPLSYALGVKVGIGVIGIWIGLSIGTAVYAAVLVLRFVVLADRLRFRSRDPEGCTLGQDF